MADQSVQPKFTTSGGGEIQLGITRKPITAWGGIAVFAAFCETVGLRPVLERTLDVLGRTSPNALPAAEHMLAFIVGVVTGGLGTLNGTTYSTGPITTNTTVSTSATAIPSQYRVRASVQGSGATLSPSEVMVAPGGHASFAITMDSGTKFKTLTGYWTNPTSGHVDPELLMMTDIQNDTDVVMVVEPITETTDRYTPENIHISQSAIFADEFTSTQVKLTLHSKYATLNHLTITGESNPTIPENVILTTFYDDGTHGDDTAGDGTFTALYTPTSIPALTEYGAKVGTQQIFIVAKDALGAVVRSTDLVTPPTLAAVDRSASVPLHHISDTEYTTPNLVNYIWPGINSPYRWSRSTITRRLLTSYGENFDLVTLREAGFVVSNEINQNFVPVGNQVQGIGKQVDVYHDALFYSSDGSLRGVIQMGEGQSCRALAHEIGHQACFYLYDARLPISERGGHVLIPTTMVGQDNFSMFLLEQPSGDFKIDWNPTDRGTYNNPYSKLELYLMGLVGPAEVTPERFLLDRTFPDTIGTIVPRAKAALVTIDDVIGVYGPRVPDVSSTSKILRMAFVVLSDRPLVPAQAALEHLNATYAESKPEGAAALGKPVTYWYATGGRGTLTSTLPPRKP